MNKNFKAQKVLIATSGGIDSSVTAYLLKEAKDLEPIAAFMRLQDSEEFKEAQKRARRVAHYLKIPFYTFDFKKDFKKNIVDYFLAGYKKGTTPNPCIVCNKKVKFGLLLKKARQLGARFIATGHYARIKEKSKEVKLMKAKDKNKDQSYFLWRLNQSQLKHILFPIGGYKKEEVKEMARKFKLPLSGVSESQEICFVKPNTIEFLKRYLKIKPGKIMDSEGKIVEKHQGLWFYTIGQRRRINLPQGPFYVIDKNLKKNILIVTKSEKDLYKKDVILTGVNWISGNPPKLPIKVKAKIRYRHRPAEAMVYKFGNERYKLEFKKEQRAVTPGQSAVFYKRNEVLGGAIIT